MKINILISLLLFTLCVYPTISNATSSPEEQRAEILAEIQKYKEQNKTNLTNPSLPKIAFDLYLKAAQIGSAEAQGRLAQHYIKLVYFPAPEREVDYAYGMYLEPGVKDRIKKNSTMEANAWLTLMLLNPEYIEKVKRQRDRHEDSWDGEGIAYTGMAIAAMLEWHPEWCKVTADKAQNYYEHYLLPFYPNLKPHLEQPLVKKTDSKTCP